MTPVFDTNILIDALHDIPQAWQEFDRYAKRAISIVTWIEVMTGARSEEEKNIAENFLQSFVVLDLTMSIAQKAAGFRQSHRLKFPDAVILATARTHSVLFVTRDAKDFPADDPYIRIPYRI